MSIAPITKLSDVRQLANLVTQSILWLDLEIDATTNTLIVGALLCDGISFVFDDQSLSVQKQQLLVILNLAKCLGGHNIIEFDLPKLADWLQADDQTLQNWQAKALDTLYLSSLLLPHKPSQALIKLYKVDIPTNDPIQDCLATIDLWAMCQQAWTKLPNVLRCLYLALLPIGGLPFSGVVLIDDVDFDELVCHLPNGNHHAIFALIDHALKTACYDWRYLGLCTFVGWLLYFDKPTCRRPVWLTHHKEFSHAFHAAESAFWQLNELSDDFLNQQFYEFYQFTNSDGTPATLRAGQLSIIRATLLDKDVPLGILATGGGKSLTFQLPALILSRYQRKFTVIISPLKALIQDQVINWQATLQNSPLVGFASRVAYLTSGQSHQTQKQIMDDVWTGQIDVLYLSPERLRTFAIKSLLKNRPPAFWVLDEAHTLSQWGTDFRPDFLRIAEHIGGCYGLELGEHLHKKSNKQTDLFDGLPNELMNRPRISLVTATASARVKDDLNAEFIQKLVPLIGGRQLVQYGTPMNQLRIWRDEIVPYFLPTKNQDKKATIIGLVKQQIANYENQHDKLGGVVLVYVRNRQKCVQYAKTLNEQGVVARAYHGKLSESEKNAVLEDFKSNQLQVVVCTNAFGMGIDKAGIHTVIHNEPPNNLESYVQEIGRCARKAGEHGEAFLLWCEEDLEKLFQAERDSRIANSKTLNDCWTLIKPTLKKPINERWFSASLLQELLAQSDSEQLTTQVRVALLALERYGLVQEKEQLPLWIELKLLPMDCQNRAIDENLTQFYEALFPHTHIFNEDLHGTENANKGELNRFYLPQLALMFGLDVKSLINKLRQLVEYNLAIWEVSVRLRLPKSARTSKHNFDKVKGLLGIWQQLIQHFEWQSDHDEFAVNLLAVNHYLASEQILSASKSLLACLSALDVIHYRLHSTTNCKVSPTATCKDWLQEHERTLTWDSLLRYADLKLAIITPIFEHVFVQLKDVDESMIFNLTMLAKDTDTTADVLLDCLQVLVDLKVIDMANLGDERGALFFVDKPKNAKSIYHSSAYEYLKAHYEDRCGRIHFLCHWLMCDDNVMRQTMLEDYFRLPLQEILVQYLPNPDHAKKPYLQDFEQKVVAPYFSPAQKAIITDAGRATLVLAGAGSGKTTVVVHRVAYLLMIEQIDPEKILVLAYNRLAVQEIKERLYQLIGLHSKGVTISTFHGLARQISQLSEHDFDKSLTDDIRQRYQHIKTEKDASYQWLLEQALNELTENPKYYQYIMVDEFQDIDELQYRLIAKLADLKEVESDDDTDKQLEQQGYLMVVGDDDQNLYAFRGASIEYIQKFEQNYHLSLDQKYYLLDNYRSTPNIVALSNDFIANAIPPNKRLKGENYQSTAYRTDDVAIRYGIFSQIENNYAYDLASWLANDIALLLEQNPNEQIAIIAPYWQMFDVISHYLENAGILTKRYNENEIDDFNPIKSLMGQALLQDLQKLLAEQELFIVKNAVEFLENWRTKNGFNCLDRAWQAILNAVCDKNDLELGRLLDIITHCQYDNQEKVVLISYHSAKGLEFDRVYVIDYYKSGLKDNDEYARQLYVALTRAKTHLTVLQAKTKSNLALYNLLKTYNKCEYIPQVPKPEFLRFHRYLDLTEIMLSYKEWVTENGRDNVKSLFKSLNLDNYPLSDWITFGWHNNGNDVGFVTRKGNMIIKFSNHYKEYIKKYANLNMVLKSLTTMYYYQKEREIWYQKKAGYSGNEVSHFVIIPYVQFCIPLIGVGR